MINDLNIANWNEPLSLSALFISLVVGCFLSIIISWHFKRFSSVFSNRSSLSLSLVFVCLVTILIISIVKSSLALSLGLVGALSIVRFRTPIKEPEELSYLFLAIATGLGLGANQIYPTILAVFVILFVIAVIKKTNKNQAYDSGVFANIEFDKKHDIEEINNILKDYCSIVDVKRVDSMEDFFEISYKLMIKDINGISQIINKLNQKDKKIKINIIDNSSDPVL